MCTHKISKQFYIGSRTTKTQSLPSQLDFPNYKTSSKKIKNNFEEYDWIILAEFFSGEDAYHYEQKFIFEHWGNKLLLNKHHRYGTKAIFSRSGSTHTAESKAKMSIAKQKMTDETKAKMSKSHAGVPRSPHSAETKTKMGLSHKGRTHSEETRAKIREAMSGRKLSAETKAKIANASKQRKHTDEAKAKISAVHLGKVLSDETKAKMSKAKLSATKRKIA